MDANSRKLRRVGTEQFVFSGLPCRLTRSTWEKNASSFATASAIRVNLRPFAVKKKLGRKIIRGSKFPMLKLLCVYCSSSDLIDAKYLFAAEELGRGMVARGWGLVYGGGRVGLMGGLARAVKAGGGYVVGVIPEFMKSRELAYTEADELVT